MVRKLTEHWTSYLMPRKLMAENLMVVILDDKKINKNLCVETNAIHDSPSSLSSLRSVMATIQHLRHFTRGTHILMLIEAPKQVVLVVLVGLGLFNHLPLHQVSLRS